MGHGVSGQSGSRQQDPGSVLILESAGDLNASRHSPWSSSQRLPSRPSALTFIEPTISVCSDHENCQTQRLLTLKKKKITALSENVLKQTLLIACSFAPHLCTEARNFTESTTGGVGFSVPAAFKYVSFQVQCEGVNSRKKTIVNKLLNLFYTD